MKVLLTCALLASAVFLVQGTSLAQMQHDVNYLLYKVYEDVRADNLKALEDSWDPKGPNAHYDSYDNGKSAEKLMAEYNDHHLLERHHWFSLFNTRQREEALMLYDVMEYSNDWDTFVGNAAYFRKRMNEGQFVYALYAAVIHSELTEHVVLPPLYEVTPHLFTNSEVIQEAYRAKMTQTPARIQSTFTGSQKNPEQRVAYFGEDIGMNTHHVTWHLEFPFWWIDERENWHLERKGESFFWVHHQLTVRFDAERLSNYLSPVEELHWDDVIHEGFAPHTQYKYGGSFPSRPDDIQFEDVDGVARIRDMLIMEERIRDAIAHGYVVDRAGNKIDLDEEHGIDILGDVIESSMYSPNIPYYGSLHNLAHMMLGRQGDPHGKYDLPPGVLEHFETATRDPAFFRLHKYMDNIFREYKESLTPYQPSDIQFPGVVVESISVEGNLETYIEDFEYNLINAVDDTEGIPDVAISTYIPRLNHKPFSFEVDVSNNNDAEVVGCVRIFAWPLKDNNGVPFSLNDGFWNAIELDKYWVTLTPGSNHLSRASTDSAVTVPDVPSMDELIALADGGGDLSGLAKYESGLGLPNRFLIPKGNRKGMEFKLVVVVTDGKADHDTHGLVGNSVYNHYGHHGKYVDHHPHGFPLDRPIKDASLLTQLSNFAATVVKVHNYGEHIHLS